jgi:hypothetical protein
VSSGFLNLASGVIQVPTGPNPLWMLTWLGLTCEAHMSVGYISISGYCSYDIYTISDEDDFYIKIVALDEIYDFLVLSFLI